MFTMERVTLVISGRVQGVFFRANTKKAAERLSLVGFAMNQSDGSVKVVAEGPKENLSKLIDWCKKGPPLARVDSIDIVWEVYKNDFYSFKTL
jgi:acylphosphatase